MKSISLIIEDLCPYSQVIHFSTDFTTNKPHFPIVDLSFNISQSSLIVNLVSIIYFISFFLDDINKGSSFSIGYFLISFWVFQKKTRVKVFNYFPWIFYLYNLIIQVENIWQFIFTKYVFNINNINFHFIFTLDFHSFSLSLLLHKLLHRDKVYFFIFEFYFNCWSFG